MLLKKFKLSSLIWVILLVSFILHMMFFIKNPGWFFSESNTGVLSRYGATDAYNYTLTAEQLIDKKVFSFVYLHKSENPKPDAYITPGQPIFIVFSIFLGKLLHIDFVHLAIFFNMLMSIATVYLLYKICVELFGNVWMGLLSAFLYTVYFSPYHYFRTLLTETPSMFLLCLSLFYFIKAWKYNKKIDHILFGIYFSIMLMFRPNPALIVLIALITIIWTKGIKGFLKIAPYWMIGPVLFILPWVIRNAISLHQFIIFSTQAGNPLLAGTDPFNKAGFDAVVQEMQKSGYTDQQQYALVRIKEGLRNDFTYWFSWLTLGKFIELFRYPSGASFYVGYSFYRYLQRFHDLLICTGMFSVIVTLLNIYKDKRISLLVSMFILYCGSSIIFLAIDRYGFFIVPILIIIASYGICNYIIRPMLGLMKKISGVVIK